jgi:hypothetical protein
MKKGDRFLLVGALLNFCVAVLHIAMIFIGASAYRYFGAGEEMARLEEAGSWQPTLITLTVTVFFFIFGLYALSAARGFRKLPYTKTILIIITSIYFLRGSGLFAEIYFMATDRSYPGQMILFSSVALTIGICYAIGLKQKWHSM